MVRAEAKRDAARHEASVACMGADAAESAKVQHALAVLEKARRKTEDEASRPGLRTSLFASITWDL